MRVRITAQRHSIQGSGAMLGVPQYFVRFAGCSVLDCGIRANCDEAKSLNPKAGSERTVEEVVENALKAVGPGGWIHITGGEPTDQAEGLASLVRRATEARLKIHLQTAGLVSLDPLLFDWVTVSPKRSIASLAQKTGKELLMVFDGQPTEELHEYERDTEFEFYYLQPKWVGWEPLYEGIWGNCNTQDTITALRDLNGPLDGPWRLTLQAHKYWEIY